MLNQGPYAYLRPVIRGVVRKSVEDFEVEEQLGFVPEEDPTGEHLWLWIEKRGQNTAWAAQALAEAAGLHPSKAGFAGLKDRHAVTRQWISLYLGNRPTPDVDQWAIEGVQVLQVIRSNKKIQRGRLQGNHFCLVLRDLSPIEASSEHPALDGDLQTDLNQRLEQIAQSGVPNFFGEQRFGGNNVGRARRLFAGELRGKRSAPKRG
ncbi:MAG TPA: tRNA pseudouridine(13) synthase TruD, partial [Wenzhouxiangella sp.]